MTFLGNATTGPDRVHWLDKMVGNLSSRRLAFSEGWGDDTVLERLAVSGAVTTLPDAARISWKPPRTRLGVTIRDGSFDAQIDHLPPEVRRASVRWISPARTSLATPTIVLFAASREEGFAWRQALALPLARRGIGAVLLENPYYGSRRSNAQTHGVLVRFSDQLSMNVATVTEGLALIAWLQGEGFENVAVGGYSMGGYMAALTAVSSPCALGVAALAAGRSPVPVFTGGMHAKGTDWHALASQQMNSRSRMGALLESANLDRFPAPVLQGASIVVGCRQDGYVPLAEAEALHRHWPGSELRVVEAGHISAMVTELPALRRAIADVCERVVLARARSAGIMERPRDDSNVRPTV